MHPILPELPPMPSSNTTRIAPNLVGGTHAFPDLLGGLQASGGFGATKPQPHPELPADLIGGDGISLPISGTSLPNDRLVATTDGGPKDEPTAGDVTVNVDSEETAAATEAALTESTSHSQSQSQSQSHRDADQTNLAQQDITDLLSVTFIDANRANTAKSVQARETAAGLDRPRPALPVLPVIKTDQAEIRGVVARNLSGADSSALPVSEDAAHSQSNGSATPASGTGAPPAPNAAPSVQPLAGVAAITAETVAPPPVEPRVDTKLGLQIEEAIDQLTNAKEVARAARPEMTVRHAEFGAVTMRLDATGNDLRATLSSRDPGFVPAIQAALADRFVSAAAESTAAQNQPQSQSQAHSQSQSQSPAQSQRAQDQLGQNSGSSGASTNLASGGGGAMGDPRYGSSPGSGQASSQPYLDQTGANEDDRATGDRSVANADGIRGRRDLGLFA